MVMRLSKWFRGTTLVSAALIALLYLFVAPSTAQDRQDRTSILLKKRAVQQQRLKILTDDRADIPVGVITTIAGNGRPGFGGDNGLATNAQLASPLATTIDQKGNIYIADSENNRIRKVDAQSKVITTIAGTGEDDFAGDGGPATQAALSFPTGIAIDKSNNIFIVDAGNNRIRKINSSGVISTVAGNGDNGFAGDGGPAINASVDFGFSFGNIAFDQQSNLYIADSFNDRVRVINAQTGIISTVAGDGIGDYNGDGIPATIASLFNPTAVALDSQGNLYIADSLNDRVRRVDAQTGMISTIAGNGDTEFVGDNGPATLASLSFPLAITLDSQNNLYIADSENLRIRRVDAQTQVISTVAGNGSDGFSGDGGPATNAPLSFPQGVAVDSQSNILIADTENHAIRLVKTAQATISIDSAIFKKKVLTIKGAGFGTTGATIMLNGQNISQFISSQQDTQILLSGKKKMLNLRKGANQLVVTVNGISSPTFTFNKLQ